MRREKPTQSSGLEKFAAHILSFAMQRLGMFNISLDDARKLKDERFPKGTNVWQNDKKEKYDISAGTMIQPTATNSERKKVFLVVDNIRYVNDERDHKSGLWDIEKVIVMTEKERIRNLDSSIS